MNVLVDSPVHDVVGGDQRRSEVEDLLAEAAPGVEDGIVGGAGEGVEAVRGDAVGDDPVLLDNACRYAVSPCRCGPSCLPQE